MAYIEIDNLKYRYPKTKKLALDGISLQIEKGSFLGVIGRNGAGKSTLSSAIIGLVPQFYKGAYGGSVIVDGLDASRTPVSELSRKVGLVFQNPFNQLSGAKDTVYDEVCFGMQNFGIPSDEMRRRADAMLEKLGIAQRVAIASILVLQPDVLILDEPTSQLDPAGSEEVFKVVEQLTNDGITVIMIEQKIDKIAKYSDKILLLDDGKMVTYGTPSEVFAESEVHGVIPPAPLRLSRALNIADENNSYPATEEAAVRIMNGKVLFKDVREKERTTSSEEVFHIENLSFHYTEGINVLHSVSLSFDKRPTAIIGQNGAGKTTLAKLMKGLLKPSEGSIFFKGEDTKAKTAAALSSSIGYVFQNPDDQIFKPRVLDEVMFGPVNIGMSKEESERKAIEALGLVHLENAKNRNPYDLDLHERKMVALASVIAMDTDAIILDEPTIAQDDSGKNLIARIIGELAEKGKLVVSILHDMDLVATAFARVIAMANGSVIDDGKPEDVFRDESTLMKAGLELPHVASLGRKLGSESVLLTDKDFLESAFIRE